ncbi:MAG: LysR family transcriptional regulator [Peptococcaceae bacterium]|nr:LysR family transcriptional regulator [Peptococcaceae bacterium]
MELRVLHYFLAVAREQNISAAAESLHLSQPTLSTQLKGLEQELGKQLLIRGTKGSRKVVLTDEGMILRKRAEEIFALVKKAEDEITLADEVIAGDVAIGAGESDIIRYFARAADTLKEKYPLIHYHIFSGNAEFVTEQLDKGLIDFGLVYGPVDPSKYDYLEVPIKDRFGVLMRKDAPLAEKSVITPEDLWDKPLIVSHQEERDGWPMRRWIGRDVSDLNIFATYNLIYNGSLLVEEGLGYAICFDKLINTTGDSPLCFRPLAPAIEASASIVWKRYQIISKAAEKFLAELRESFA